MPEKRHSSSGFEMLRSGIMEDSSKRKLFSFSGGNTSEQYV